MKQYSVGLLFWETRAFVCHVEHKITFCYSFQALRLSLLKTLKFAANANDTKYTDIHVLDRNVKTTTGWSKKTAQSLWHYNFVTVHHRVKRFSAKCSERNSLHD